MIYNYLINTPGPYTGEALNAYKSLDAYNYFVSGHVKEVTQNNITDGSPVSFIKASVEPGQRVTEAPFKPWLCLDAKQGYVISSHCTCMAGLGEACSHVAALLFAIEAVHYCGINTEPACTSVKCIWNKYYKEKVDPCIAEHLDITHPVHGKLARRRNRVCGPRPPKLDRHEEGAALQALRDILPTAAACVKYEDDTDSASESEDSQEPDLPPVPYRLARVQGCGSYNYSDILSDATASKQHVVNLGESTKSQSNSALWNAHRIGRVTASNCYRIVQSKEPGVSALRAIMQYDTTSLSHIPAVKWGIDNELNAKEEFCSYMKSIHEDFQFENTGLVLYPTFQFLAASPDGLVKCKCQGISLLEVKCPYKYRSVSPVSSSALGDSSYCLNQDGLKKNHKYYCQVQTQLIVTNSALCNFVVWTPVDFKLIIVNRDESYIQNIMDKVQVFVQRLLVPELLSRKLQFANDEMCDGNDGKLHCSCRKHSFSKMIACDNEDCAIGWYHYECVGIRRKPKGKWYCVECQTQR